MAADGVAPGITSATAIVEALRKLGEAVKLAEPAPGTAANSAASPAADSDANSAAESAPKASPLVAAARKAKADYQKTARWVLAAFAAVGVLIFGSLPFANITETDLAWPNSAWLVGSLLVAALGIVAAVVAVSLVSEPEDASLGELETQLRTVQRTDNDMFKFDSAGKPTFKKWPLWWLAARWNPRRRSRMQLCKMLHGGEAAAHLGPSLTTVTELIAKLGELEQAHADSSPQVARLTVRAAAQRSRREELVRLLEELRKRQAELAEKGSPQPEKTAIERRLSDVSWQYEQADRVLNMIGVSLAAGRATLAEIEDRLRLYARHRTLVLVEGAVMQLRGTFRLARRILAVAAILTLLGGIGYAITLPASSDQKQAETPAARVPGLPATVVVNAGAPAAAAMPRACVGAELSALWVSSAALPASTGPFTVVVTAPAACRGQLSVGKGEGTFQLID